MLSVVLKRCTVEYWPLNIINNQESVPTTSIPVRTIDRIQCENRHTGEVGIYVYTFTSKSKINMTCTRVYQRYTPVYNKPLPKECMASKEKAPLCLSGIAE